MSKGGFKAFRGSSATASAYLLETSSARLDEYYSEGRARSIRHVVIGGLGLEEGTLTSAEFKAWMEHRDPETAEQRGTFRQRMYTDKSGALQMGGTPLFQETLITSSKSLSLAAAADPRIGEALEAAMARAVVAGAVALQQHAVTRVGPKGGQYQVKLEQLEVTSVQHKTSRSGDPHFHRHMQLLPKGFADGQWRAIDGVTLYRLSGRVHAAADLSMSTDMELRAAIAAAGFTWEPGEGGGRVSEFEPLVDEFSSRRDQIAVNREAAEVQWRAEHPGQEPGPRQLQAWDQLGWAQQRPEKNIKSDIATLGAADLAHDLDTVVPGNTTRALVGQRATQIDPRVIAESALADLSLTRSAWSSADLHASIDRRIAQTFLLGNDGLEALRSAALEHAQQQQHSLFDDGVVVEGSRHFTSEGVMATELEIQESLVHRAERRGQDGEVTSDRGGFQLSEEQVKAAKSITGSHALVVIEGAAGSGKTTMLDAANERIKADGRRMVVVSPTKRGALEAGAAIGAEGNSVHSMLYRAGAAMDENDHGKWILPETWKPQPADFAMDQDTVLVVDECGMLDQETARVLHKYIDDQGVGTLVLTGDTKQLAAVGRGGYMARAAELTRVHTDLRDVRRFRTATGEVDTEYAQASVVLRDRKGVDDFYELLDKRGQVRTGAASEVVDRVSETVSLELMAGEDSLAVASTNATAQRVNHAVFEHLSRAGVISTQRVVRGLDNDPIAAGARVATRRNDRELDVANRQTFTVHHVNADGRVVVKDEQGHRRALTADYVAENLQLAYCVTAHGAQGMTVDTAHTILSDQMDAAGAYVGLTRGRRANVLHAVAVDGDDAKGQFGEAMAREGADLGLSGFREQALGELAGLDLQAQKRLGPAEAAPAATPAPVDRPASGLSVQDCTQAELVAVVRSSNPDGGVQVDFQLASYAEASNGQAGLRLRARGSEQELTAREYARLTAASGGEYTPLDANSMEDYGKEFFAPASNDITVAGKHVIAVRGDIVEDPRGWYTVQLSTLSKSLQQSPLATDVLAKQRTAQDEARSATIPDRGLNDDSQLVPSAPYVPAKPVSAAKARMLAMQSRLQKQNTRQKERDQSQDHSYGIDI